MSDLWESTSKTVVGGMYPILFWSIVTIGVVIERALYLSRRPAINK